MSSRSPSENGSNVGGGGGTIASTIRRFKTLSTTTTTNLPPPVDVKLRRIATKENLAKIEVHKAKKVDGSWFITATAMVAPFAAFCFSHQLGLTEKALKVIYNRVGVHGFLALPFMTLAMEKSIYDTVQAIQGIDPYIELEDGEAVRSFPQGGSNLPSFALCAVRKV